MTVNKCTGTRYKMLGSLVKWTLKSDVVEVSRDAPILTIHTSAFLQLLF